MEYLSSLLCQATRLAAQAYDGAFQKGTHMPRMLHAMETAEIAGTMTGNEDVLAAAVLHDVLENGDVTAEELRSTVGSHVTEIIQAVTEAKHPDRSLEESWHLRKQENVDKLIAERRIEVKMVVLAATLSDMRAISRDYPVMGEKIWERFHNTNKAEQGWYYQAMCDALQDLNTYPVWHELANLVWEVFWQDHDSDQMRFEWDERDAREMGLFL